MDYTGDTFESKDWERSYSVDGFRIGVTWLNGKAGVRAYLDTVYAIAGCPV